MTMKLVLAFVKIGLLAIEIRVDVLGTEIRVGLLIVAVVGRLRNIRLDAGRPRSSWLGMSG